jgi:hypothetical protein
VNATFETFTEPAIQEPPITQVLTPPLNFVAPEQHNPNTSELPTQTYVPESHSQNIEIAHPEPNTPQPEPSEQTQTPPSDKFDDHPSDHQEHHISTSPTPSETMNNTPPSSPISYGSSYKPLTIDELSLPSDFALPILENMLKQQVDIDDEPATISTRDLKKIKIIHSKRKRHEPTIPFNRNHPFFNPTSEPNLELLDIAISISLKRFKSMEEEILVFPSDVDAEIRDLEAKFSESLMLLGDYVKSKIQGKGMNALRQIMTTANQSHAPRLTFYNHEEECQRLELLAAAVNESIRTSLEAAKRIDEEEAVYAIMVIDAEQARIAAEVEAQKLAEMGSQQGEDTIMNEQDQDEQASDKGKNVVVDTTPPNSPIRIITGSSSIPPVVQATLDDMRTEMKNEIVELKEEMKHEMDELRADMRADLNASGEATHKKMDEMMSFLQALASQMKKP